MHYKVLENLDSLRYVEHHTFYNIQKNGDMMSIQGLRLTVAYVGTKINPDKSFQGKTLMFCNGINNDLDDAKKNARIISEAFGGRQVVVCHNPTTANDIAEDFLGSKSNKEKNLSILLGEKIIEFLTKNSRLLILFVHSHAALLAKKALKSLDSNNREKVRVYSFGGITMIPKRLAIRVENYIFDEDIMAFFGNTIKGVPDVLNKVLSINAFMLKNMCLLNQAIKDTSQAEVDNRQNGDNQTYEEKVDSYLKCFEDYNIKVLQIAKGLDQRNSQSELNDTSSNVDLPTYQGQSFLIGAIRDFRIGISEARKGIARDLGEPIRELNEGIRNGKKNHAFSSFKSVVQSIAQKELSPSSIDNNDLEHQLLELRNELCNRILDIHQTSNIQISKGSSSSTISNSNPFNINNSSAINNSQPNPFPLIINNSNPFNTNNSQPNPFSPTINSSNPFNTNNSSAVNNPQPNPFPPIINNSNPFKFNNSSVINNPQSNSIPITAIQGSHATRNTMINKILELFERDAILQDEEIRRILEAKYKEFIHLDLNQPLSDSDELFFRHASRLLDSHGKIIDFIKQELAQSQSFDKSRTS